MKGLSRIDTHTIQAYQKTEYHIHSHCPLILKVDHINPDLKKLYTQYQFVSCAWITACNPFSIPISNADNKIRNHQLQLDLQQHGFHFLTGTGKDPLGQWEDEPGYLIGNISLKIAKGLGNQYEQNAILWCDANALPHLILLR